MNPGTLASSRARTRRAGALRALRAGSDPREALDLPELQSMTLERFLRNLPMEPDNALRDTAKSLRRDDRIILRLLQADAHTTVAELSEEHRSRLARFVRAFQEVDDE